MKKLNFLLLAVLAIFAFSCNSTETTEEPTEVVEEEVVVVEEPASETVAVPEFENADFAAYVGEMDVLMNKTITALKAGDQEGLAALDEEGKALEAKGKEFIETVSEADKAAFEGYIVAKTKEAMAAAGMNMEGMEEVVTEETIEETHEH